MSKQFWKTFALTVATVLTSLLLVVGQTLLVSATISRETTIAQVTSITGFTDFSPNDWSFQNLQSLVERYGCVSGFKNKTIQPARAIQAAELINMLSACMGTLEDVHTASTAATSNAKELGINAKELGIMQKRVDEIEANVSSIRR